MAVPGKYKAELKTLHSQLIFPEAVGTPPGSTCARKPPKPTMSRYPIIRILPLFLLLAACGRQAARSEKAERAHWEPVYRPAFRAIERDRSLQSGLHVYDSIYAKNPANNLYVRATRYDLQHFYHYFFSGNYAECTRVIDSAIGLFDTYEKREAYPRTYTGYLMIRGELAFRQKKFDDANQYYFLAKTTVEQFLDSCEQSTYYYSIGMALYRQKNFGESLRNFKEAYARQATCMPQNTPVALQQQEIQGNIGLCYIHLKQYDSALYHFRNELAVSENFRDSLGPVTMDIIRGVVYGNMAKVYVIRKDYDSAALLYRASLALNNRRGYELRDAQLVSLQLADLLGRERRYPGMRRLLDSTRGALDTLNFPDGDREWRRLMYVYYDSTGQQIEELQALKNFVALRDSLDDEQRSLEKADITRQLRNHEQELQIGLLRRDNQLARVYLWVAVLVAVLTLGIIALVLLNYRRSRRNLAAQQLLNAQIAQQKAALERANQEKDRILHVVAHDLRSPIGVSAYVAEQLLQDEHDPSIGSQLELLRQASKQALALTNELLGLHDEGQKPLPCALRPLMETVAGMLAHQAREKNQELRSELSDEPIMVLAQPERLQRAVSNLLSNAIKFSPEGRTVELRLYRNAREAVLEVIDEGIGIPGGEQQAVFDRFTSVRRKGTAGEHSFGLGLSIVRDIVEAHGGRLELHSREGAGTRVVLRLPLCDPS
ncbi:MAG: sensor histidine kinase [Sphingobacteriales bacterium]|nr:MAG: sensor histidine kinase [Sphingobacteriales bacterium]